MVADADLQCPPGQFVSSFSVASGVAQVSCEAAGPILTEPPTLAPTTSPTASPTAGSTSAPVGTVWSSTTAGTLNGVGFSLPTHSGRSILSWSFTASDFSAAPLGSADILVHDANDPNLSFTFGSPVSNLRLYLVSKRGVATANGPSPTTLTFSSPFSILSGLSTATASSATTLQLADDGLQNGIIQFAGPLSSLSWTTTATGASQEGFTFGV